MVLVTVILGLLAALGFGHDYTATVNHVSASVVRITSDDPPEVCTGFVVADNRVVTAAHCLAPALKADGLDAAVVKADPSSDLLLLAVTTHKSPLHLRERPAQAYESATAIGYGFGWTVPLVLQEYVVLSNPHATVTTEDGIAHPAGVVVQGQYIAGMSGGPLVDRRGDVIGIAQQFYEGIGSGASATVIRAFLTR